MDQQGMFPPAVEAMSILVTRGHSGWSVRIAARLEGERWHATTWHQYDHLSMAELLDVIDATAQEIRSENV